MTARELTEALGGRYYPGTNRGNACCPAHEDKTPSLSIAERDGKLLYHCHAGCSQEAVRTALQERGIVLGHGAPQWSAQEYRTAEMWRNGKRQWLQYERERVGARVSEYLVAGNDPPAKLSAYLQSLNAQQRQLGGDLKKPLVRGQELMDIYRAEFDADRKRTLQFVAGGIQRQEQGERWVREAVRKSLKEEQGVGLGV